MSSQKTVLLHIGTPKTGTTSVQKFLMDHARKLKRKGVLYPMDERVFWHWAHHPLAAVLTEPFAPWVDSHYDKPPAEAFAPLREIIEESSCDTIVVSSEQFSLANKIGRVRELLPDVHIRVVCYFRWQVEFLRSWYRQAIVTGGNFWQLEGESFDRFIERWAKDLDHHATARKLEKEFGAENIELRVFDRNCMRDGDIVSDFLELLGLPSEMVPTQPDARTAEANVAVSGDMLELKALANRKQLWKGDLKRLRRFSSDLEHHARRLSGKDTHSQALAHCFGPEKQALVRARFLESNRRFLEDYGPPRARLPEAPSSPPAVEPRATNIDLERMSELLVASWQAQDERQRALEAELERRS